MGSDRCTRVGRSRGYGAELEFACESLSLKNWWETEAEEPDIGTPADAFREALPTYFRGQVRVQL